MFQASVSRGSAPSFLMVTPVVGTVTARPVSVRRGSALRLRPELPARLTPPARQVSAQRKVFVPNSGLAQALQDSVRNLVRNLIARKSANPASASVRRCAPKHLRGAGSAPLAGVLPLARPTLPAPQASVRTGSVLSWGPAPPAYLTTPAPPTSVNLSLCDGCSPDSHPSLNSRFSPHSQPSLESHDICGHVVMTLTKSVTCAMERPTIPTILYQVPTAISLHIAIKAASGMQKAVWRA